MNKTYAISDLHGQYNLWAQVRDYLDDTDRCYVLGDCIDRGPDGYKILKEVLADNRCLFIIGNHEDMMVNYFNTGAISDKLLWFHNGGEATYEACKDDPELEEIVDKLIDAPNKLTYNNIFLTHAGFTPGVDYDDEDLIWDRNHIYDRWWADEKMELYSLHGHTPIPALKEMLTELNRFQGVETETFSIYEDVEMRYCGGHKICIDAGCFMTHKIGLFNLDTLEVEEVFYEVCQ